MGFPSAQGQGREQYGRSIFRNHLPGREGQAVPQHSGPLPDEGRAGAGDLHRQGEEPAARAGSYFLKAAGRGPPHLRLVDEIRDIDYLDAESEIDALLMEARLIKDILPKYNRDLRDNKTFPYLEIFTARGFSPCRFTREPIAAA